MPNLFELRRFSIFFLQPTRDEQKMGDLKEAALHDAQLAFIASRRKFR